MIIRTLCQIGKSIALASSLSAVLLVSHAAQAATEIIDQVVAIVDDDIIMASELRMRLAAVTENLEAGTSKCPPRMYWFVRLLID